MDERLREEGSLGELFAELTNEVRILFRQEDRLMGEARDTLVHRAEEVAEETMGRVEKVAEEAERATEEEAQRQDMTS